VEEADVIFLWGSNARETHPIFFHHVLKAIRRGAKLFVMDPRRTSSAEWADGWLQLDVGTDIALANCMGRCILEEGLEHRAFIDRATEGFDAYARVVEKYDLARVSKETQVSPELIQRVAREYARADKAIICWTLGITEHHNAVDNVTALINLALLTGHVGRWGSGLNPLRGQNNVQGGGDMGALPNKLAGFQDVEDDEVRARFNRCWGRDMPPKKGWNLTQMFEAMDQKTMRGLYVLGENPAQSEADSHHTLGLLGGLEHLVVQDIVMTKTAEMADVVLPGSASWCEADGTVTNSERRVQRCRRALTPPGQARDDIVILAELSKRLGYDLGSSDPETLWNELRSLSPMHRGMSYARIEELGGIQWPCPDDIHPGTPFLHGRLWSDPVVGPKAPFLPAEQVSPVDTLDASFPLRLTTGRRLESYNTGVQSGDFAWPHVRRETLDVSPEDAQHLGLLDGETVRIVSRRGSVEAPVRLDRGLRKGLVFMTVHFPDAVDTNILTINATDPKSGTAEFKASAVRVEKLSAAPEVRRELHAAR
jgi:predicted molibdopterin-dependent oxidoreductase YjgC